MDKDKILQMSRKENEGKGGEWEQSVEYKAGRAARIVGLTVCILLMLLDDLFLNTRIVGMVSRIMFFSIEAASNIVLYRNYRKKTKLIWAIVDITCAIGDLTMLIILAKRLTWMIS